MVYKPNILIVEDEVLIALRLELAAIDSGARVLGPFGTTAAAFTAIVDDRPQGAILDVNLWDGPITPVAQWLLREKIPVVLHSAQGAPEELAAEFPDLPSVAKPAGPFAVVARLLRIIETDDRALTCPGTERGPIGPLGPGGITKTTPLPNSISSGVSSRPAAKPADEA